MSSSSFSANSVVQVKIKQKKKLMVACCWQRNSRKFANQLWSYPPSVCFAKIFKGCVPVMSSLDSMVVEYVSKLKELCLPVVQLPEKDKDFINVPSKEKVQAHTGQKLLCDGS